MTSLLRLARSLRRSDSGMALPTVIGLGLAMLLMVSASMSVAVSTSPPKTRARRVSSKPTLLGPTVPVAGSTMLPPPSPIESTSGMRKLVRTPPTWTMLLASLGKPRRRQPTSVVVPPTSTTMASSMRDRKAAPRMLLVGPDAKLLQPDPEAPAGLDYVLSESTYGHVDRPTITSKTRRAHLAEQVRAAHAADGPLLIPAFAVERTQELIVDLVDLMERGEVPAAPIFLDSPLAIRATEVFRQHASALNSEIDVARVLSSSHLRFTETVPESKAIARFTGFHIIIAGSGMCDAGRIRHHLKRWLWHTNATVLLSGFQAQGTLGRILEEGAKAVRIQGEEIKVTARIASFDEYSGHADGPELARWIAERRPIQRGIFLVHGEEPAISGLSDRIAERILPAAKIFRPILDDIYELTSAAPTPIDGRHRRRLAPEAVVALDWHNDMSELVLDINDRIDAAADDRARGVIIRRLRRALEDKN